MPSTNETPLGLNQWIGTDKPTREDFNRDNRIIDAQLSEKAALSQLSNPNILHNWDFRNPVNQRGQAIYSENGYTIDRWRLVEGSVTLTENGLTLNGTIIQPLEYAVGAGTFASVKMHSGTASATYNNSTKVLTITSNGGTVESAKLELSTVSTLANDPPADYGVELAKCRRYYNKAINCVMSGGTGSDGKTLFVSLESEPMRITPKIVSYNLSYMVCNGTRLTASSVSTIEAYGSGVTPYLQINLSTALPASTAGMAYFAKIDLDANL